MPFGIEPATGPAEPCPYLPDRVAVLRGFRCDALSGAAYQQLMDAGFRRSGRLFYQPVCPGCRACRPLRVAVASFRPGKSLRRVLGRNPDLRATWGPPELTPEKAALYARYLATRHDGAMTGEPDELEDFLYRSPTRTIEACYRDAAGRLLAVGICDLTPVALSSVYFFFDPSEPRRGLGTLGVITEIAAARRLGLAFYYPGFWVARSPRMAYKARFRPSEVLGTDGVWRPLGDEDPGG